MANVVGPKKNGEKDLFSEALTSVTRTAALATHAIAIKCFLVLLLTLYGVYRISRIHVRVRVRVG